ncbi:MAG: signal peptidase II [Ectothiorhodospiraceae bacterium]|nr:signal peptidase II [Ectothiorhodospiraceae bacterium]
MLKWLWLSAVVVVLDLGSKAIATHYLQLYQPIPVFPGFNWMLAHNAGAAFSFLSNESGWQRWFFSVIALAVSIGITLWIKKLNSSQTLLALGLSLVLGGAIGNLWDRVTLGYVVDFIDVYYQQSHWPAFNIADSAICVGAVLLVLDSFRGERDEKQDAVDVTNVTNVKIANTKKPKAGA